jgi:hypothetical protein
MGNKPVGTLVRALELAMNDNYIGDKLHLVAYDIDLESAEGDDGPYRITRATAQVRSEVKKGG